MNDADQFARKTTASSTTFAFRTQSDMPVSGVNMSERYQFC